MVGFGVAALFASAASAKQARGPITGVIGLGEEGQTGGSANGELAGPSGVAIHQSTGDVYVVDSGNNRVEMFNAAGAYVSQFNGGAEHALSGPSAIAVDQQTGDVYVADTGHNVVDKFTASGEYICALSGVGRGCQATPTEPSTFSAPAGVAVDPTTGHSTSGDVYVSDRENRVVDVFTELGGDVAQFAPGARPWALAVDSESDVLVALAGEGRIDEYDAAGAHLIGEVGEGARTVGVDLQQGNIFIGVEVGGGGGEYQLEEFNPARKELDHFGRGLMSSPGVASPGIAVSSATNVVYAADTARNVVDLFGEVSVPDATACSATAVNATSATLHGEVNPEGTKAESSFRYAPTIDPLIFETPFALVGEGAEVKENLPVEAGVAELIPGTAYKCKLVATNSFGLFGEGPEGTFETPPLPPSIEEPTSATDVTTDGAILTGFVNPGNGSTFYHFAYGTEAGNYPHALASVGIGIGLESIPVEEAIPPGSLTPNTVYHFALIASNPSGTVPGPDETFKTTSNGTPPAAPPVVSTGQAEAITPSGATLTGLVYPEGTPTTYLFEAGTTTSYGTVLFGGEAGREGGAVPVALALGNLQPGVTFHYRLVAVNAAGTTFGLDRTFLTPSPATGIVQPITPQLLAIPVFPVVKVPLPKPPKPHKKKHKKKRPKGHRAQHAAHAGPKSAGKPVGTLRRRS
jgi:DNA-binding beta-propeller fold protein YncE